jgi:hypothetical protein
MYFKHLNWYQNPLFGLFSGSYFVIGKGDKEMMALMIEINCLQARGLM